MDGYVEDRVSATHVEGHLFLRDLPALHLEVLVPLLPRSVFGKVEVLENHQGSPRAVEVKDVSDPQNAGKVLEVSPHSIEPDIGIQPGYGLLGMAGVIALLHSPSMALA